MTKCDPGQLGDSLGELRWLGVTPSASAISCRSNNPSGTIGPEVPPGA